MGSQKGKDRRKDLALRGHTAADTRKAGTRRANTHVVRLVGVHTQQVGSQVEVGMPRILLVAVDTHVEEGNLVVAGTGHMVPHIRASHGTQTGPYLDSAKSKRTHTHTHRDRISIDTQTVDDSRTHKRCECCKMRLPGEGAYTTLRHSKERQRRPGFVKLSQFNCVWMNESGRRGKFLSFTTNLPLQFHTLTTPNIPDYIPIYEGNRSGPNLSILHITMKFTAQ